MHEEGYWSKNPCGAFQLLDREQAAAAFLALWAFVLIFHPYIR